MGRILLAIRAFFATLFSAVAAARVRHALEGDGATAPALAESKDAVKEKPKPAPSPKEKPASEALVLLAALQREGRLIDFLKENLEAYSDEQVGAAARDVQRDCDAALERMFALRPLMTEEEDSEVDVAEGFDPDRYRLTGNVTGEPPFRGRLTHHGWEATALNLPQRSGSAVSAKVIAPAEVEL